MLDSIAITRLYANVLHEDIIINNIPTNSIRVAIKYMGHAYSPEGLQLTSTECDFPNFNDAAFRTAYLHKYAPMHTYIVLDVMLRILTEKEDLFLDIINAGEFKFCCLGGGPGTDVIGILGALYVAFNSFKSSVTVIDCMVEWESTFESILRELFHGEYGNIWNYLSGNFEWSYVEADLLQTMTNEANKSIASASFVTMIKFLSAASCTKAEEMVEKIFRVMKPGALVLYIDNAAGGYTQVVERASRKYHFQFLMTLKHKCYENENLKTERFGFPSCFKTTVSVLLLKKPGNQNKRLPATPAPLLHFSFSNINEPLNNAEIESDCYKFPINQDNLNHNSRYTDSNSPKLVAKEDNLIRDSRRNNINTVYENVSGNWPKNPTAPTRVAGSSPRSSSSAYQVNSSSSGGWRAHQPVVQRQAYSTPYVLPSTTPVYHRYEDDVDDEEEDENTDEACGCCVIS